MYCPAVILGRDDPFTPILIHFKAERMTTSDAMQNSAAVAAAEQISKAKEDFDQKRSVVKNLKAELKQAKKLAKKARKKLRKLHAALSDTSDQPPKQSKKPSPELSGSGDVSLNTSVQPEPRRLKSKSPRKKYPDRAHQGPKVADEDASQE